MKFADALYIVILRRMKNIRGDSNKGYRASPMSHGISEMIPRLQRDPKVLRLSCRV